MDLHVSDGYRIDYEVVGEGLPLVFLHDGILPAPVWDAQMTAFATTHRVVRYNRRGYGLSALPEQPYSNLADLHQVLDHLDITSAVLVGASSGGGLVLDFTLAYPTRVQRMVLVGSTVTGLGFSAQFQQRQHALFQPLVETHDLAATIERFATDPYLVSGAKPDVRDDIRAVLHAQPHSLINPQHLIQSPPTPAACDLARLDHPTLLITGMDDCPDVHMHAGAIAFGLRQTHHHMMPSAGHFIYLEYPEVFTHVLWDFLQDDAGTTA